MYSHCREFNYKFIFPYVQLQGFQPNIQSIQQLTGMGFTRDDSVAALKKHSGNVDQAIESLLDQSSKQTSDPPPQTRGYEPPARGYDPQARGYSGRGRQGEFV